MSVANAEDAARGYKITKEAETTQSRRLVEEFVIPKCSSKAFLLTKGQVLRVIAHEGKQVADLRFLNAHDYREQFAAWNSLSLNSIEGIGGLKRIKKLYSKPPWQNVMLTVIDDKVGDHNIGIITFEVCLSELTCH